MPRWMNASMKLVKQRRQMEVSRLKGIVVLQMAISAMPKGKIKKRKSWWKLQSESDRLPGYDLSGAKE